MRYFSTRGGAAPQRFCAVLLEGLAPDGGLMVPEYYPQVDGATLERWRGLDYASLALEVLVRYCDDIPRADLERIAREAYSRDNFGSDEITPLVSLSPLAPLTPLSPLSPLTPLAPLEDGLQLLALSNGPTLAFKDLAMQLLGRLFEYELARRGARLNVLGATSGDTGSAAEHALRGRAGINVFMLSPQGRMSAFQRAQMYSLADANIFNIALAGVFDDCQDLVKAVAADLEFKRRHAIGSVNSINWARIMAQVVYYFRGYFAATATARQTATAAGPVRVSFCVPSGNFGNLLAGWIARKMGLPIARLVLATNENNVLDEFFRTGRYRVRGAADTWATSSPSMDISKASNFERFIFDLVGRNPQAVRELWGELDARGAFDLGATPFWPKVQACDVVSGTSRHADRLATIRQVYEATGRIVDPHTADGIKVAREYCRRGEPMICLETAQPAKFAETIVEAIGRLPPRPAALDGLEQLPQRCEPMPIDLGRLKAYLAAHAR